MEYVPGETLAERLARQGALPLEAVAEIGIQLCDALGAVHSHPFTILHRDIKPSNVLLAERAGGGLLAKLTDFGLAQLAGESGGSTGRRQHHPGTPSYMAPEQEMSAGELSGNADLYALGLTLGEALTGRRMKRRLLDGESCQEILAGQSAWLIEALARATHEDRRERCQRAGDLKKALEEGLKGWAEAREREKREAAERERQAKLAGLYIALTTDLKAGKWTEAIRQADEVLLLDPRYRDVAGLRVRAQAGLRTEQEQAEAARQKEARLAALYQEADAASEAEDWATALARCREIEGLQPGYRDVARLQAEAEGALQRQREQQAQVAALYSEAVRLLRQKQYQAALDKLGEVQKLDPTHPDLQRVAERAQAGLDTPPRPPWWLLPMQLLRRAARPVGVLLIIVVLAGAGWRVAPLVKSAGGAAMTRQARVTSTPTSTHASTTTPSLTPNPALIHTPTPPTSSFTPTATSVYTGTPTYTASPSATATKANTPTPSVTPTATASATASSTPTTPTPSGPVFTVNQPVVNVRAGPGTDYLVIGTLKQAESYEVTGRNAAGNWWQFTYGSKPAWVASSGVKPVGQFSDVPVVATPTVLPPTPTSAASVSSASPSPAASMRLSGKIAYHLSPEWRREGTRPDAKQEGVYLLNLVSSEQIFLGDWIGPPTLSTAGRKLAYISGAESEYSLGDIVVMDFTTGQRTQLTERQANRSPALSGDGSKIAYVNGWPNTIYVWEGGLSRNLAAGAYPAWSPDDNWIVYCGSAGDDIRKISATGGVPISLAQIGRTPAWGASHKIAYARDNDIWVMNEDGTGQTPLTNHPGNDYQPSWSPDGTKIVFVSERDGNAELYVMNADGSDQERLTNTLEWETKLSWSR